VFVDQVEGALEAAGGTAGWTVPRPCGSWDLAGRLAGLVRRSAREQDGTPVTWLGDGVMVSFRAPAGAVVAALAMVALVEGHGLARAHVGIHAGPVIFQEGTPSG
jgi:class 3 adenylate cyclase